MTSQAPIDIHPAAREIIRIKARVLRRQRSLSKQDREDIEQELALHAHVALARYDPRRSAPPTFYSRVIDNRLCDLMRRQSHCRREVPPVAALEKRILATCDPGEAHDLMLDVEDCLAPLPGRFRQLAERLMNSTQAQAAHETQMTRAQVRTAIVRLSRALGSLVR